MNEGSYLRGVEELVGMEVVVVVVGKIKFKILGINIYKFFFSFLLLSRFLLEVI